MKRHLPAFFLVALVADLGAHTVRYGFPDPSYVLTTGLVVLLLSGYPFAVAIDDAYPSLDAGEYGPRLLVALAVAGVVGAAGFWALRGLLTGEEQLIARLVLYPALVPLAARVANHAPVDGDALPEHGRYWGTPWEDRETIEERSE
jgi:hypothetical protein